MVMKVNPDLFNAKHLRIWYDAGGRLNGNQMKNNTRPATEGKVEHFTRSNFTSRNFSAMENHRTNRIGKTRSTKSTGLCRTQSHVYAYR